MQLADVSFAGPAVDDADILGRLPHALAGLLQQVNGFIRFQGGFHLRGACREPAWHSLRDAWLGDHAFHRLYPNVTGEDVPFAEDCLGDQFLLRDGEVWRLAAETGEVSSLGVGLGEFLRRVQDDPVEYLSLHPLVQFTQDGGALAPGQLLAAYPPFCTREAADGVRLAAVPADERRQFLADFAAQIRDVPEGGQTDFNVAD